MANGGHEILWMKGISALVAWTRLLWSDIDDITLEPIITLIADYHIQELTLMQERREHIMVVNLVGTSSMHAPRYFVHDERQATLCSSVDALRKPLL